MKFIAYYRVSTTRQDYGIEAQKEAVLRYVEGCNGEILCGYEERESGSINDRPQLANAIAHAKSTKSTLIIAKLDRLSRNAAFLMSLQDSHLDFVCCDMPNADKFTIGILALVAQRERELISQRTVAGLAIAKAQGVTLGNPRLADARQMAFQTIQTNKMEFSNAMLKHIAEIKATGISSLNRIADCLNKRGERTARKGKFTATTVKRILALQ